MKTLTRWLIAPMATTIALTMAGQAWSQTIAIAPNSGTVQVSGTSGGAKTDGSCAKHISAAPNHVIQVSEETSLRFTLQSAGEPALLIRGASGENFCVPADGSGTVVIPGRWKGNYSVFVGDRANQQHPYTLSIAP